MSAGENSSKVERTAEFVRLFAAHNRKLYLYARSLIYNAADADEVFQNTCEVLWQKFDDFEIGSDFFAWACSIARYEALGMRRRRGKEAEIFTDQFYHLVEKTAAEIGSATDDRQDALADCLQRLSVDQRKMIELRYEPEATTRTVAAQLGRSVNAIYKSLRRCHELLFECVESKLGGDRHEKKVR